MPGYRNEVSDVLLVPPYETETQQHSSSQDVKEKRHIPTREVPNILQVIISGSTLQFCNKVTHRLLAQSALDKGKCKLKPEVAVNALASLETPR